MSDMEQTRIMGAAGGTVQMPAGGMDAYRTQMGGVTTCPVCQSASPMSETYCGECGFLLSSAPPAEAAVAPVADSPAAELIDVADGRRYRLKAGMNTLGRVGTDLLIAETTVSRNHAKIAVEGDTVTVEDLGSSNGTKVGDRRLAPNEPVTATHGTPMRFGNWRVLLEIAGGAAMPSSEPTLMATEKTEMSVTPPADSTRMGEPTTPEMPIAEIPAPAAETPTASEPAEPAIAMLERTDGPASDIALPMGTITLGRKAGNTVVLLNDSFVSGSHAEITTDNTGSYFTDLGSTNGTVVNGQKLPPHEKQLLLEGDEIQLGQSRYTFRLFMEEDEMTRMESEGDPQHNASQQELS